MLFVCLFFVYIFVCHTSRYMSIVVVVVNSKHQLQLCFTFLLLRRRKKVKTNEREREKKGNIYVMLKQQTIIRRIKVKRLKKRSCNLVRSSVLCCMR